MNHKFITLIMVFFLTGISWADDNNDDTITPSAMDGIDYLIDFIQPDMSNNIDMERLNGLIDFVRIDRPGEMQIALPKRLKAAAAYYEFDIQRKFEDIISLTYHPDIPLQMVSPGSVRLSYWVDEKGNQKQLPSLQKQLDTMESPFVIRGVENEVITPDMTTGAYYRSLLDRVLILNVNNGKRILISLAKQKKKSDVGKKGLIIGADERWNYFFTNEKGLTKTGLGWVDSYIYDTFSVVVYYASEKTPSRTKCSLFKWLRAGWTGMNMVKPKHIRAGFKRFSRDVKRVLESPKLPNTRAIAHISNRIKHLSDEELKKNMRGYLEHLMTRVEDDPKKPYELIAQAAANGYVSRLEPQEMQATLFLEVLKHHLGMLTKNDIAYINLPGL